MKVALCFIINYDHILNKEEIWREWIEHNKDIINVYFYYKEREKIHSKWILEHAIPEKFIYPTSYFHVVPAYLSLIRYACITDNSNLWFSFLTDSCCPIMSPKKFRQMFFMNYDKSILSWREAWWNVNFHQRANLRLLPAKYKLANDPYFTLNRRDAINCLSFIKYNPKMANTILEGGLANESFFAIVLKHYKTLDKAICSPTHMVDWSRMMTSTSPYLFRDDNLTDRRFIETNLDKKRNRIMFIRKISILFPDDVLREYIYGYNKNKDNKIRVNKPLIYYYYQLCSIIRILYPQLLFVVVLFVLFDLFISHFLWLFDVFLLNLLIT